MTLDEAVKLLEQKQKELNELESRVLKLRLAVSNLLIYVELERNKINDNV